MSTKPHIPSLSTSDIETVVHKFTKHDLPNTEGVDSVEVEQKEKTKLTKKR